MNQNENNNIIFLPSYSLSEYGRVIICHLSKRKTKQAIGVRMNFLLTRIPMVNISLVVKVDVFNSLLKFRDSI